MQYTFVLGCLPMLSHVCDDRYKSHPLRSKQSKGLGVGSAGHLNNRRRLIFWRCEAEHPLKLAHTFLRGNLKPSIHNWIYTFTSSPSTPFYTHTGYICTYKYAPIAPTKIVRLCAYYHCAETVMLFHLEKILSLSSGMRALTGNERTDHLSGRHPMGSTLQVLNMHGVDPKPQC